MVLMGTLEKLIETEIEKIKGEVNYAVDIDKVIADIDWVTIGNIVKRNCEKQFSITFEEKQEIVVRRLKALLESKYNSMSDKELFESSDDINYGVEWYLGIDNLFEGMFNGNVYEFVKELKLHLTFNDCYEDYSYYDENCEGTDKFKHIVDLDTFVDTLSNEFYIGEMISEINEEDPRWFVNCREAMSCYEHFDWSALDERIEERMTELLGK